MVRDVHEELEELARALHGFELAELGDARHAVPLEELAAERPDGRGTGRSPRTRGARIPRLSIASLMADSCCLPSGVWGSKK